MSMEQHEQAGLTLLATPIVRQVVTELRGLLEHVEGDGCDPEMERRLRTLIGKLEAALATQPEPAAEMMQCEHAASGMCKKAGNQCIFSQAHKRVASCGRTYRHFWCPPFVNTFHCVPVKEGVKT